MRIFFEKRIIGRILTAGRLFWEIISSLVILESSWREDNFLVKVLKSWKIHFGEEYLFMLSFDIWQKWSFVIQDSWKIFLERSIFFFFFCHWYSPRRIIFLGILNSWRILLKQCCFEWMILNAERRKQCFNLFKKNTSWVVEKEKETEIVIILEKKNSDLILIS